MTRCFLLLALGAAALHAQTAPVSFPIAPLSPAEELETIELPEGYRLELVLSEPEIKEPVAIAFDGDGKLYVAEMRTYMQDIDGTDELTPKSRISLHQSSKRDGVFDRHSVFLDDLLLPRMILPMDDRVLVGITNTNDLTLHRDTDGDGVADEQAVWYTGGPRGGNMEHQPSGLVWGLDNWIYTTYNNYRLRWNGEGQPPLKETTAGNGGQWGLAQDDSGKMWWSNAGGEKGLWNYQLPILYAAINVRSQKSDQFDTVWPIVALGDFQGGPGRFHSPEDKRLNHFTGCGGQTVFRGDRLPEELYGNVFLPEPVGRLIRRAIVEVKDGVTTVTNPHEAEKTEFIRSSDPYFRPLNMTTGPDGCLYIVDCYRGIIQEGNWVKPGSFLRGAIEPTGMQHVTGRGRVWRLVHEDFPPGPQPKMLSDTPAQLVAHLAHPNGWWRDTAQRMLIVKGDRSVVPALADMAARHDNPLARIHALWTLDGLGVIDAGTVRAALRDSHPQLRAQGIRLAEAFLKNGDPSFVADIKALRADPDPTVVLQAIATSKLLNWPAWKPEAQAALMGSTSAGVREIGSQMLAEAPRITGDFTRDQRKQLERGQEAYLSLCFACHGFDGSGMPIAGKEGSTLAPPLARSRTVVQGDSLIRVLLNGLAGPVDGKTYESQMVSMASMDDQWLADVASYLRKAFGNNGKLVTKQEVAALRKQWATRADPWTISELASLYPQPLPDRASWKLTASHNEKELPKALDGDILTRWDTRKPQSPEMWLQIELPALTEITGLILDTGKSGNDYPREYQILLSDDGTTWAAPVLQGTGNAGVIDYTLAKAQPTKFIRIRQTGSTTGTFWSIHELEVLGGL
jgi:mono/diheme cytochrome c family protein/glucose/arabinose dehydrogenase